MIRVVGIDYEVVLDRSTLKREEAGATDFPACQIIIDRDMHQQKQEQTLWHEIMHVVCEGEENGGKKCGEDFITRVSNQLYAIFRENGLLSPDWWERIVDNTALPDRAFRLSPDGKLSHNGSSRVSDKSGIVD